MDTSARMITLLLDFVTASFFTSQRNSNRNSTENGFLKIVKNFRFPNIPLKEQQTIVRQLDALRAETQKLEAVYQQKMDDLEELKKSILQKAFSGGLNLDFKDSQITTISKKSSHQVNQA